MQLKSFVLPVMDNGTAEEELNKFLRGHRVLQASRQFSPDRGGYWAVLVEYMDGAVRDEAAAPANRADKKDYSKELSEEEYKEFQRLREIRKEVSKQLALPAYLIFTNEELAVLARQPELIASGTKSIKGVSDSHVNDFLSYFIPVLTNEAGGATDGADSSSRELA